MIMQTILIFIFNGLSYGKEPYDSSQDKGHFLLLHFLKERSYEEIALDVLILDQKLKVSDVLSTVHSLTSVSLFDKTISKSLSKYVLILAQNETTFFETSYAAPFIYYREILIFFNTDCEFDLESFSKNIMGPIMVFRRTSKFGLTHFPHRIKCDFILPGRTTFDVYNLTSITSKLRRRVINLCAQNLRVSMFERLFTAERLGPQEFTGFDYAILRLISYAMNFTIQIVGPKDGCTYGPTFPENSTYCGIIGDLVYNRADLEMNGLFIKPYITDKILFTFTIFEEKLCIVVPSSQLIPQWKVLLISFPRRIWLYIFLSFTTAATVHTYFRKLRSSQNNFITLPLEIFPLFVLQPPVVYPKYLHEKIFLASLSIFCLVVCSCFQGSLLALLEQQIYEKDMNSYQDFDKSGLNIFTGSHNLFDTFDGQDSLTRFSKKLILDPKITFETVARMRNASVLDRKEHMTLVIAKNFTVRGESSLHIMGQCPRTYNLAYATANWSPYYESINTVIGRILQAGLIFSHQIGKEYLSPKNEIKKQYSFSILKNNPQPLSVRTFKLFFGLLISGYLLGIFALLLELIFFNYSRKKKDETVLPYCH